MNQQLIKKFPDNLIFKQECFVADYSNSEDIKKSKKGVILSLSPFFDIEYFTIKKQRKEDQTPVLGVNFEKYPSFVAGIKCCECFFIPLIDKYNSWVLFLEMKYCDPKNAASYATEAFNQLKSAYDKLLSLNLINRVLQQIYFVFSVPKTDTKIPFENFITSPASTIREEERTGIHLMGANSVVIATPQYLLLTKKKI